MSKLWETEDREAWHAAIYRVANSWTQLSDSTTGGSEVKASASNTGHLGSIHGLGRSPGEGNGNPLTPVVLPGESHGQRSLVGYSPWGRKESDTTEQLNLLVNNLLVIQDVK